MLRRVLLVAVLATVVLAGCSGPTGPDATEPTDDGSAGAASASVPGVTNGTLTNATALAAANQEQLLANGGTVTVDWDTPSTVATFELVAGPTFETYTLSGSPYGAGPDSRVSIWSNESSRYVHTTDGTNESYRVAERRDETPNVLEGVVDYLAAGNFAVANGSATEQAAGNGTVVLTADEYVGETGRRGLLENPSDFDARLVVDESGLIHELTVDATDAGETHAYTFTVTETGVESVPQPEWLDDVPSSATLRPELGVDVANESSLSISHEGGDDLPSGSVLSLSDNETSGEATFESSLAAGDTRYAYFDNETGELRIVAEQPEAATVDPLESPVSVTIESADGVTFHSSGMAWGSESASEPSSEGGGDGGRSTGQSASESESSAGGGESSASEA